MNDILGWRGLFGVLGPSTNTVVQPEFDDMRPDGVTNHYSRILTPDAEAVSNESFLNATLVIANNVLDAVDSVMTCSPSYLVMGMSAITFYGGAKGADDFQRQVENRSNLSVSIGSHATSEALKQFGGVKKIGFLSPYFPAANEQVRRYFEEVGFDVVTDVCLECPSWTQIAQVPTSVIHQQMKEINNKGVDALVQVGTNLPMARLAAEFETEFDKPVIAINTATYWHALRANNMHDQIEGFGSLMSQH
ncbi:MAG: arylmalonate decarboxylase [Gammaproteobacteria bacterium]|jgi:maleate isomerase|nr:arylmalonate decarboxylase [Gammaproteobacteria bacterium]MBT6074912.1 arylmalonate decarboxylase [Gammaproteobacteria bacterium]MDG2435203.1 arylmalonate decarboxylase [Gammaproteobacteria bacterium]